MTFTIPAPELNTAINGLRHVADKHVKTVRIEGIEKGILLSVNGTGDSASYTVPEGTGKGTLFLRIEDVIDLLKCIRGDTVHVYAREKGVFLSYVEDLWNAVFETKALVEPLFGENPKFPKAKDMKPFPEFLNIFRFLMPFASTDETRFVLNGVLMKGNGEAVATDGRRMTFTKTSGYPKGIPDIIVPMHNWLRRAKVNDECSIGVVSVKQQPKLGPNIKTLYLKAGPWSYSTKTIDGTYPNYQQVVPKKTPEHMLTLEPDSINAFKFMKAIIQRDCRSMASVTITKQAKGVFLRSKNIYSGRVVKVELNGKSTMTGDVPIGVSYEYLMDSIRHGFTEYQFEDSLTPLLSENDGWTHVLMPMRIE